MQETSRKIEECIFYKLDKVENLSKLDNFRKILYSEFETERDISNNLFEIFDDVSLLSIGKETNVGIDSINYLMVDITKMRCLINLSKYLILY